MHTPNGQSVALTRIVKLAATHAPTHMFIDSKVAVSLGYVIL